MATPDPVARYVLDGRDADLRRLLGVSALLDRTTRSALATVDVRSGWRVLECGCGPVGAMPVLAGLVGPTGTVVGVDVAAPTVERARSVITELGLDNVEVRLADINDAAAPVGGPYDLAFSRCFLMHQPDPLRTLTRVHEVLRPGGWFVAMEPLPAPAPFSHPANDELRDAWELLRRAIDLGGASPTAVQELPSTAERAGFEVVQLGGSFQPTDPATGFGLHAATTTAVREQVVSSGAAPVEEVDRLIEALTRAQTSGTYAWVTSPVSLTVTMRKPPKGASTSAPADQM
jgi:SAM-dependent methyltransferase